MSGLPTDYANYYFQVQAVNAAGASGWSPNNTITVSLETPGRPSGSLTGEGTVSLDWNDIDTATSYKVHFRRDGAYVELTPGAAVHGISITFDGSSATVSGLPTDYANYYFQVQAVNAAGLLTGPQITPSKTVDPWRYHALIGLIPQN